MVRVENQAFKLINGASADSHFTVNRELLSRKRELLSRAKLDGRDEELEEMQVGLAGRSLSDTNAHTQSSFLTFAVTMLELAV
jgi:hypothetical protein